MPKLVEIFPFIIWLRVTTWETIKADFIAGLTGAVLVFPQGIAFATIAGMPPEYGLYTAMVVPIIAALFGSSFHLVSGPTTAISIVVFATISQHAVPGTEEYIAMVLTLTFLAGIYQLAFGLAKFGVLVNFVSHNVVIGFTTGAAFLIASSQITHILGISTTKGVGFIEVWKELYFGISEFNGFLFFIGMSTVISAILIKRYQPKLPNLFVGLLVGGVVGWTLKSFTSSIITVGNITAFIPPLSFPDFSIHSLTEIAPGAFAVALLGLIEASSIGRSIATKSNQKINSNQEFIGQGVSNIVGSFFSSYASSGSFTRTGVNYESGAKTPLSAILAALILIIIVLLVAPFMAYLPIASMAGIILLVAYNLIDSAHIKKTFKYSKSESIIFLVTFASTLLIDLEFAIYLGVLLSLLLFIAKTSAPEVQTLAFSNQSSDGSRKMHSIKTSPLIQCPQLKIIKINMSIYFGSINHIQKEISTIIDNQIIHHILIVCDGVNFVDLTGVDALLIEQNRLKKLGGSLYFVNFNSTVNDFMEKVNFIDDIGKENFFKSKGEAINSIYARLDEVKCRTCRSLIFKECN
ncbi:MAG TPA: SulP family inorganic anion transporter [Gammaproteobacteria bacterium]|nr:SulP family inorganic anion transporter [Gammaproteobacteria bacterium]